MDNRTAIFGKILGIIILIALAQVPIYFMQQYSLSIVGDDYFIHLRSQAIDYTNRIIESVRGNAPATAAISRLDNYRFVIDTLNSNYLTLALGFLWLLVIDVLKTAKLSWINYFIVAIGLVLFYLLELVLANYCPINQFYFISVAVCTILLVGYLSGILKSVIVSVLYGIGLVLIFVFAYYLNLYVENVLVYVLICLLVLFIVIAVMPHKTNRNKRVEVINRDTKN